MKDLNLKRLLSEVCMKTFMNTKLKAGLIGLFTMVALLTTACQPKGNNNAAAPAPYYPPPGVYPGGCATPGCSPYGQVLYGGTTVNGTIAQAQFQVSGDMSGNGMGSLTGTISFTQPYYCSNIPPGSYPLTSAQQGTLSGGAFQGTVIIGPMQAMVKIIPAPGATGFFSISFPGCYVPIEMNFQADRYM
jgi:hypothetical protein